VQRIDVWEDSKFAEAHAALSVVAGVRVHWAFMCIVVSFVFLQVMDVCTVNTACDPYKSVYIRVLYIFWLICIFCTVQASASEGFDGSQATAFSPL